MRARSRQPGMPWRFWWLALCCGVVADVPAHSREAQRDGAFPPIQVIVLERDCFTCANSSRLSLHRNGTAELVWVGKARFGGGDRRLQARLTPAEFEAMADLLQSQGFFALADNYDDAETRDGDWANWRVERGAEVKQVFCRSGQGPEALVQLEAAMLALQARLDFNPDP